MLWAGSFVQQWNCSNWMDWTLPFCFKSKTSKCPGRKGMMLAGVSIAWVRSVRPSITVTSQAMLKSYKTQEYKRFKRGVINYPITFGFWAYCKESIICEEFEQRPDTICISTQKDFSVSGVQQNKSKDTIQERSHHLDAKAVIQMEQNLTINFSLVIKLKLLLQLKRNWRISTNTVILNSNLQCWKRA